MRRMKEKVVNMASRTSSADSRKTAKNVLINILTIAKDAGDGIPGAAPLFGGILQVVQEIDKSAENVKTLEKLEELIQSLKSIFSTIKEPEYLPDMQEDVKALTKTLNDSLQTIEEKRSHNRARLFANRHDDEADLRSLAVDIQSALTIYQANRQLKGEKRERLRELSALSSALKELPFVPEASFDSSQNTHQTCFEGTRVEILQQIQQWIDDEDSPPLFWLNGIAGTGKSTIAQTVAYLSEQHGVLGANFFFSRMVAGRHESSGVLPTLAYQLARYDDQFKSHLVEALKEEPDAGSKILTKQMEHLILRPFSGVERQRKIVIVLDALDECDERGAKELLQLLLNPAKKVPVSVRILVTSRPEAHIRAVFQQPSNHTKIVLHDIEQSVVGSDIDTYVVAKLREIAKDLGLPEFPDWFSEADRKELVRRAGKLFIYAATAMLFIGNATVADPLASMKLLLHPDSASDADEAYQNLDLLYTEVLLQAIRGAITTNSRKLVVDRFQEIMGTIVLLRDPLSMSALAQIAGGTKSSIQAALWNVHSVIAIDHRNGDDIPTIYHPSFLEFITNPTRCKNPDLLIDAIFHERRLAIRCLELLTSRLKRDIVGIHDSSLLNSEVEGLGDRVQRAIPAEVQYACKHWSSHLTGLTSKDTELLELLEIFATKSILFWFEAMSLLDSTSLAAPCLEDAREWAVRLDCGDPVKSLLNDGYRFILANVEPIKVAALHVYYSALPFAPHETTLRNAYQHEMGNTIKVLKGVVPQWSACLNTLLGHTGSITDVAFSSDGSRLASSSRDHTICLWDAATGAQAAVLEGHTDSIKTLAFFSGSSRLASGSSDKTVRLWDAATGAQVALLEGHTDTISTMSLSSDDSRLASGSYDHTVRLWDAATGAKAGVLKGHTNFIQEVTFSTDGSRLASGSSDNTVRLWDAATGTQLAVLKVATPWINTIAFSPDDSYLASGSHDYTLRLWDVATAAQVAVLEGHTDWISTLAFSSDGSRLASGSRDHTVRLWDAVTGAQVAVLGDHTGFVNTIAFSLDNSRLASGSNDHTVRLWDAAMGSQVAVLEGHTDFIKKVSFSADGSRLASGSGDKTVRLWNATTGAQFAMLERHTSSITTIAFSSDNLRLASGSNDNTVRLWDAATGSQVAVLEGHTKSINTVTFSPDGSRLASGSDDYTIRLWDAVTGAHVAVLQGHTAWINEVAFSPDGSRLASSSSDYTVRLWDAATGALMVKLMGHPSVTSTVAFSTDGLYLTSKSWSEVPLTWDLYSNPTPTLLTSSNLRDQLSFFTSPDSVYMKDQWLWYPPQPPLSPRRLCYIPGEHQVHTNAIASSRHLVALGCKSGQVLLLDISRHLNSPPIRAFS